MGPERQLFKFLVDGENTNMVVTSPPATFSLVCPPGNIVLIRRVTVLITGSNMTPNTFGSIPELINGLKIEIKNKKGELLLDYLDGRTIKKNADWAYLAGIDIEISRTLIGDDVFSAKWVIGDAGGPLSLEEGQKFEVIIQDDLTGISSFRIMLQGYQEKTYLKDADLG